MELRKLSLSVSLSLYVYVYVSRCRLEGIKIVLISLKATYCVGVE